MPQYTLGETDESDEIGEIECTGSSRLTPNPVIYLVRSEYSTTTYEHVKIGVHISIAGFGMSFWSIDLILVRGTNHSIDRGRSSSHSKLSESGIESRHQCRRTLYESAASGTSRREKTTRLKM